jgi:hypothetical protein
VFLSVSDESKHVQFKGASASEKRLAAMAAFGWTAEECMVEQQGEQERIQLAVLLTSESGLVKRQATALLTSLRSKICNRFAQNDKVRRALVLGPPFEAHTLWISWLAPQLCTLAMCTAIWAGVTYHITRWSARCYHDNGLPSCLFVLFNAHAKYFTQSLFDQQLSS